MKSEYSKSIISEVAQFELFKDFSPSKIEKLCVNLQVIISKHRQSIFNFADPAYRFGIVLSGAYKLSRPTVHGEDAIMHFSTPGDVIAALIMGNPDPKYPVTVTSMGPSRFLSLPKENYQMYWKDDTELIFRVQNLLSSRMHRFHSQKIMQKASISARIAQMLLMLAEKSSPDELQINIPLTRKEIADNLGLTVESVIRVMSDWSKFETITTTDQIITILKPNKLLEIMKNEN